MAGTPAQKAPILREAVKPQDTLQAQQRLTPPAPNAAPTDQQAKDKAGRLAGLGSYGSKMAGLIAAELTKVAPTATALKPTVNAASVAAVPFVANNQAKQDALIAALNAYIANPADPVALRAVSVAMGRDATNPASPADVSALLTTTNETLTAALTPGTAGVTAPKLGGLDLSPLGLGDDPWGVIAQDLGTTAEALKAMTPDQFQQAVQDVVTREYSSTQALRAELRTASPNRKAQILQELHAADATGRAGVEASVADLYDRMESQETVKIGDDEYSLKDIFSDDGMSKLVLNAVGSDTAFKELQALSPGLAQWIADNRAQLETLAADMGETVRETVEANTAATDKMGDLGIADTPLAAAFDMPTGPMTPAESAAWIASVENDPLWKAATADETLMLALKDPDKGPDLVARLRDMSPATLSSLVSTSNKIKGELSEDEQAILKSMGITWDDGFLTDSVTAKLARDTMALFDRWGKVPAAAVMAVLGPLRDADPAKFTRFTSPGGLNRLMASMDAMQPYPAGTPAGDAFRNFLGVSKGATYIDPGFKGPDGQPVDYATAANAFAAADSAFSANTALKQEFYNALAADLITTTTDLKILTEKPQLVTELLTHRADSQRIANLSAALEAGEPDKAADAFARTILGSTSKKVGFDTLTKRIDDANEALSRGKAWRNKNPQAAKQAADFLALLKKSGLDMDGDGRVEADDLRLGGRAAPAGWGPNYEPTAKEIKAAGLDRPAVMARLIAKLKAAGLGDETHESVMAGKSKPSTLPKDLWATYGAADWSSEPASASGSATIDKGSDYVERATAATKAITPVSTRQEFTGNYVMGGKHPTFGKPIPTYEYAVMTLYEDGHEARTGTVKKTGKWDAKRQSFVPPG